MSKQTYKNYHKEYRQRPEVKAKRKAYQKKYKKEYRQRPEVKERRRTRRERPEVKKQDNVNRLLLYHIRQGNITPQPCEHCGTVKDVHGHHEDYDKPLEVIWLCVLCHAKHHESLRS